MNNGKKVIVKYANMFGTDPKGTRQHQITIPSNGSIADDLETIFRYMNHVDGDANGVESQLIALKERSMSVGDSAIIDGREFLCMMAGWKELTDIQEPKDHENN